MNRIVYFVLSGSAFILTYLVFRYITLAIFLIFGYSIHLRVTTITHDLAAMFQFSGQMAIVQLFIHSNLLRLNPRLRPIKRRVKTALALSLAIYLFGCIFTVGHFKPATAAFWSFLTFSPVIAAGCAAGAIRPPYPYEDEDTDAITQNVDHSNSWPPPPTT